MHIAQQLDSSEGKNTWSPSINAFISAILQFEKRFSNEQFSELAKYIASYDPPHINNEIPENKALMNLLLMGIADENHSVALPAVRAINILLLCWLKPVGTISWSPTSMAFLDVVPRFEERFGAGSKFSLMAEMITSYAPKPPKGTDTHDLQHSHHIATLKKSVANEKMKFEKTERQLSGLHNRIASSKITIRGLQDQNVKKEEQIKELEGKIAAMEEESKRCPVLEKQIQLKNDQIEKLRELVLCPICMDRNKNTSLVPCSHAMCTKCANLILGVNNRCPICRVEVESLRVIYL